MALSNPIWNYFKKEGDGKAKCKECNKLYSLGSDQPRYQTVTGLRSHLAKCHKDINDDYLKRVAENDDNELQRKKRKLDVVVAGSSNQTLVQPTLTAIQQHREVYSSDVCKRIDKVIIDVIIVDIKVH